MKEKEKQKGRRKSRVFPGKAETEKDEARNILEDKRRSEEAI